MFPSKAITLSYWINRDDNNNINGFENYISKENSFQSYLLENCTFSSGFWKGEPGIWSGYEGYKVTDFNSWIFYAITL